eukprot:XP_016664000.1 PREDICTED: nucleic-acid-binding protein from mobile element jockey-like [Acyrthosiphon pisum]
MPSTPNINNVQKKKTINSTITDKSKTKNSTIQSARLTIPTNSTKGLTINSEYSSQSRNMSNPTDGEWIQKPMQKNKRILSSSSSDMSPKTPPPPNKKLFTTQNRFEALNPNPSQNDSSDTVVDATSDTEDANNDTHIKPPPPIFMKGVLDFPNFCAALKDLIGVDHFFSKSAGDRLKIQTSNPESYRILVRYLKESKSEYHTFQLREDKPTRVVIRHIHPSTPTDLIKTELEARLFEVRQVTNVLHKATKFPLPLFLSIWNQLLTQMAFTSYPLFYIPK